MTTVTRPALLSALRYLMQAPGITPAELVGQDAAVPDAPAVHIATLPRKPRTLSDNDRRVIEAAGQPHGVSVDSVRKLLDIRDAQAHRYCATLTECGRLTGVKKPGIRAMRFFSSPELARAWAEGDDWTTQPPVPGADPVAAPARVGLSDAGLRSIHTSLAKKAAAHKAAPVLGPRTQRKPPTAAQNITFAKPAPVSVAARNAGAAAPGDPIITAQTKITRDTLQRPTAAWQLRQEAPDERWPSFSATPPGCDPATGKPWERRA